jgi:hypothetical protein
MLVDHEKNTLELAKSTERRSRDGSLATDEDVGRKNDTTPSAATALRGGPVSSVPLAVVTGGVLILSGGLDHASLFKGDVVI